MAAPRSNQLSPWAHKAQKVKEKPTASEDLISRCPSGRATPRGQVTRQGDRAGASRSRNERGAPKPTENLAFNVNSPQLGQAVANTAERSRKAISGERARRLLPPSSTYSGREVTAGFKLLQQARQDEGGEEEDAAPEEDIGRVGAVASTGGSVKLSTQIPTVLEKQSVRTKGQRTCGGTRAHRGGLRISGQDPGPRGCCRGWRFREQQQGNK